MIVYQNRRNQHSQDMLAPSGSGSLDWEDLSSSNAADILSLVLYGAERELREECSLDEYTDDHGRRWPSIDSKVIVMGFARMLHRAGKPEFFCLGYIAETSDRIIERRPERYVEYVMPAPVEPARWSAGRPRDEIARVCKDYLGKTFNIEGIQIAKSYPVEHALMLLVELCEEPRTAGVLDRFIGDTLKTELRSEAPM
jgi:hypothetical protein